MYQYDHPEGLRPMMNERSDPKSSDTNTDFFNSVARAAPDESFHEMTGNKGDVILMHPLMLHSASKNGRRLASEYRPHFARWDRDANPFQGSLPTLLYRSPHLSTSTAQTPLNTVSSS